ncbi:hypothetical protein GTR04_0491 [Trichophyton interdigitale]|uniref:Uncharacterized protein n=1 Tax=Trichophyton interdigitale TaxID=101480 RepID=A0A9P4YNW5_9EURO|nr:hypothetical protein GY631_2700 [Trichophyton interdigitale]KAF3901201.1 hypothetical protein GY632_0100 [Trichophyton interdigitale]KAG8212121.1 hypothetical protein GTR04_0491 [Trichophyton interdigitale]
MSRYRSSAPATDLSREHQETIEDLLYRLLYPIRTWRDEKPKPSKGRRWKKLERRKDAASKTKDEEKAPSSMSASFRAPEVLKNLTIGFNSTVRSLESMGVTNDDTTNAATQEEYKATQQSSKLSVVFICRSTAPMPLVESLSFTVKRISDLERGNGIRLVYLSKNAETRMADAVGVPRLGVIGIKECQSARILIDYVRENVPPPVY